MGKIFIYYSLSGNGDAIANNLNLQGVETRKVETKKKYPKSLLPLMLVGGFSAAIKKKDELLEYDKNISNFDEVIIGSPIWNSRIASPINTVLNELDLVGKKVSFILWSGSGEGKGALKRINKEFSSADVKIIKQPLDNRDLAKELQ